MRRKFYNNLMLEPILSGIGFGLILAVMLGPVFFTLLQTALHEGFKAGSHLAFGVLLSDGFWIAATWIFASQLDLTGQYRIYAAWVGGLLLIVFGILAMVKKFKVKEVDDDKKTVHAKFILKGFLLNSFNPAVPLFWLGVIGVVKMKEHYETMHEIVFFGTILATVFATDLLKAFVAHRLKEMLNAKVLNVVNKVLGIILIVIGVSMVVKAYSE